MVYFVYVLESQKDHKKYIGQTNDIDNRLKMHNTGKVISTKYRQPLKLVHLEKYSTQKEAVSREKLLKTHKGYNILKKLGIYKSRGV